MSGLGKTSTVTKTVLGHRLNLQMISSFEFGKYDDVKKVSQEEFAFSVYSRLLRDEKIDRILSVNSVPEIYKTLKKVVPDQDIIKRIGSVFEGKQLKLMLAEASKSNMANKVYVELLTTTKDEDVRQDIKEYDTKRIRQSLFRGEKGHVSCSKLLADWLHEYDRKMVDFNEKLDDDAVLTLKIIKCLYCNKENLNRRSVEGINNSFLYIDYGDSSDLQEIEALLCEVRKELSVDFLKKYDDYYNLLYAYQYDAEGYFSSLLSPFEIGCNFLKKELNLYFEFLNLYVLYNEASARYVCNNDEGLVSGWVRFTQARKREYELSEHQKVKINKIKEEISELDKNNSWMRLKAPKYKEETAVEKFYKYLLQLRNDKIVNVRKDAHSAVSRLIERFSTQDMDRMEFNDIYEKLTDDVRRIQIDVDNEYLSDEVRAVLIEYKKFINYDFLVADNEKAKRLLKYVYVLCGGYGGRKFELEVRTFVVMLRFIYLMASETKASDDCGRVFLNRIMRTYNKYEMNEDKKKAHADMADIEFIRLLNLVMYRAAAPGTEFQQKHFLDLYHNATQTTKYLCECNYKNLYVLIFMSIVGMKLKQEYLRLVTQK